jgi:PIN domain nuclease of toxin-antitoxin system
VRLLLDTHVALWWLNEPVKVSPDTREAIEDTANEVWISSASVWEAGLKTAAGKLRLPARLDESARASGLLELAISWAHARAATELPRLHADPFDRILVAQASLEDLVVLTRDPLVRQYDVASMPA